jgi:predicted TIM-barrel fold metal-dependent hydrolase
MTSFIDAEAHCLTDRYVDLLRSRSMPPRQEVDGDLRRYYPEPTAPDVMLSYPAQLEERLLELGEARVEVMDQHGITAQVVSLTIPAADALESGIALEHAQAANDALAAAMHRHPGRFVGLASLAPMRAEDSAAELERCVTELGFRGANIHSHVGDLYLDDRSFWPIFEMAERLGVPINIHPTCPHGSMIEPYLGYGWNLTGPGLGFGHETAVEVSRMLYSGVFDAYPELQLMLGHCGEALPFWMYRLDFPYLKAHAQHRRPPKLDRLPSEYLAQNCWYNCSGNFFLPALTTCLQAVGSDRVLFASDYPYESYEEAVGFMATLPVSAADRTKIASTNALRLFGLESSGAGEAVPSTGLASA